MSSSACEPHTRFPIGVIGAGAIGRMHIERLARHEAVALGAIADPTDGARLLADRLAVPWFADYRDMLASAPVEGAIVATPNATHAEIGLACIARGLPVLMEKPVADNAEEAQRLCDAATAHGVPLMVGHQRRHNPIMRAAKALIADGVLGRPVSVNAMATWLKPDSYYDLAWRRQPGGGPVLINLIHDIDMLRYLLGEIAEVQALTSNALRGFEVEDTAAVTLRFANGALGTMCVSDAAVSPWNWDLAAGEASHYAQQDVNSHFISGTEGSLTLPRLDVWRYRGSRGWHAPLTHERTAVHAADPYTEQLRHFRAVAEGQETPVCSGPDALRTLQAVQAVLQAARTRQPVSLAI